MIRLGITLPKAAASRLPALAFDPPKQTKHIFGWATSYNNQHPISRFSFPRKISAMASSDSEDADLKQAIALSLQETARADGNTDPTSNTSDSKQPAAPSIPTNGLAGLNRKQMEEERQARRNLKRDRSISPPALGDSRKAPKLEQNTVSLPSGARLTSFSSTVNNDQQNRKSEIANAATQQLKRSSPSVKQEGESSHPAPNLQGTVKYPTGVVKKTWAFGFERKGNDVKLEEVLEPQTLTTAVLSAFQWDPDWVEAKLKTPLYDGTTKCIFIMQAEEEELRQRLLRETQNRRKYLRLCFPPMDGQIKCMHSKLMLLFHPAKLRIAIPTANLVDFDWGETGAMENSVFMIDLPRLPAGNKAEASSLPPFGKELLYYLQKQGVDEDVRKGLLNFDFSATRDMMFVHTVGGINQGDDAQRTGLPGLARAVRQLGLQTDERLQLDFAASSIGALNNEQLQNLHAAARGDEILASSNSNPSAESAIRDRIRVYFPTEETVRASKAGAAGTICISRRWWAGERFPRSCFRDYRSVRSGLLSHNKILYARGKARAGGGVAWAYVGSANLSESAWGKVAFDKRKKGWKVHCRNWECGVLLPVSMVPVKVEGEEDSETESEDETSQDLVGMNVFDQLVPPPFEMPGAAYNGREPWFFYESEGR